MFKFTLVFYYIILIIILIYIFFRFAYDCIVIEIENLRNKKFTGPDGGLEDQNHNSDFKYDKFKDESDIAEDGEDEWEEEDDDDEESDEKEDSSENIGKTRPSTTVGYGSGQVKKLKKNEIDSNRIKNLRKLQLQNKQTEAKNELLNLMSNINENPKLIDNEIPETAKNRPTIDKKDLKLNIENLSSNTDSDKEEEENLFLSDRNVQTVKVNQTRKSMQEKHEEIARIQLSAKTAQENSSILTNRHSTNETKKTQSSNLTASESLTSQSDKAKVPKILSDKDKRLAEKVASIRQNMAKHERYKKVMKDLRPFIIGGSLLIGSLVLYQLYKKFFSR
jgi:hypothetical protein